jgi:hypothetical protein
MKLYKCYVKQTQIREGFLFVEAESLESAKSLEWVEWALDEMDWDELPTTQDASVIESAEQVTSASQVPESQMKEFPWYNPSGCHEEERRLRDWVKSMTPVDISEGVEWRIGMRMRELKRIQDDVKRLKRYLKKQKGSK